MPNLQRAYTPDNPLMQPVTYQGQEYFTAQYFHQLYLQHSRAQGKHRRHDSFMRLLRSIEAYAIYAEKGDIVELIWTDLKIDQPQNVCYLQPLFKSTGYQQLTLLNATAQLALANHLDDEISKQIAVAANTTVARQATRKPLNAHTPLELATRDLSAWLDAGKLFGTPLHIVQQEGVKLIAATHGVNFRPLLKAAPAQDNIAPAAIMLEPTDLAKELGIASGIAMNTRLEAIGWQVKKIGGGWEPTPAGAPHTEHHAWSSDYGTKSGYNWKWNLATVRQVIGGQSHA